jgi:hypothetical protein
MGNDHLLQISESSYSEEYKRFYFRDIQAITVCVTRRQEIWNLALAMLMLLSVAILQAMLPLVTALAVSLGLVGVPFLVNNIRGQGCRVYLRTRVQTEELPSLNRVKRAQRILSRIRPLISTAQGQWTPEEFSRRMAEMESSEETPPAISGPKDEPVPPSTEETP